MLLTNVKELLRLPVSDTTWDTMISDSYDAVLNQFIEETDILVEREYIPAVMGQHIYTASTAATRILGLLWNRLSLMKEPARSMDYLSDWLIEDNGSPEYFIQEKIPPGLDGLTTITPNQFAVSPAPQRSASGEQGFVVYEVAVPVDLPTQYLDDYFLFATAAEFLNLEHDIHDAPASQFWSIMADLVKELIMRVMG